MKSVLFVGPVDEFGVTDSGYGNAAAGIAYVLKRMEKQGLIRKVTFRNTIKPREMKRVDAQYDVGILVVHPNSIAKGTKVTEFLLKSLSPASKRYLSIVWETDTLPEVWDKIFDSDLFDGYLTPSKFVADMVIQKAKGKPVYYYPHYVDTETTPTVSIDSKANSEDIFTALYVGQHTKRKGLEDAVVAFIRTLGYQKDARLILKYHTMSERELEPMTLTRHCVLCNTTAERPEAKIHAVVDMLDGDQMYQMYQKSSMLLFPTRGEGFGLPLAEAMAVGIPIVYTNWSSASEICQGTSGNFPVGYTLDEAHSMLHHGYARGSKYAVPLMSDLMNGITQMYQLWKVDRRKYYESTAGNRDIMKQRFGYDSISRYLMHIIEGGQGFVP